MIRKIEDFQKDWAYETESTVKLFNNLTDASLGQKVTPDGRSLGFLAWHIVVSLGEMPALVGLTIDAPEQDAAVPDNAAAIVSAFEKAANSVSADVAAKWTDEMLLQEDDMYGEKWARGLTLLYLMMHQAHHRGQMTVLRRQAGIAVTGIYGPSKEEWEQMGMAALA
jgi:uncharacterized damage-inducible protein DinB